MATLYRDAKDEMLEMNGDGENIIGVLNELVEVQGNDFDAMAGRVINSIKAAYPMNCVPEDVVDLTGEVVSMLTSISKLIDNLIVLVQGDE